MSKKKKRENQLALKLFTCLIYLVIITVLFVCSYNLFQQKKKIIPWSQAESVEDYSYIDISKMSEKFAYYEESDIGLHFIIEEEKTGQWHTYVIAIKEKDYEQYKKIIDYTYERIKEQPNKKRVYGYPVIIDENIKSLAIKNIINFIPAENEVEITNENYEKYLTNSYLDTTKEKKEEFSITLFTSLLLLPIVGILFLLTIIDKKDVTKIEGENQNA